MKLIGSFPRFLPLSTDFVGLSGRGVPSEVPHTGQDPVTLYVSTLEGSLGDRDVRAAPLATVPKLWYAHAHSEDYPTPDDRKV